MFLYSSKDDCIDGSLTWAELKQKSVREASKNLGSVSTFRALLIMQTFSHTVSIKGNRCQLRNSSKPPLAA